MNRLDALWEYHQAEQESDGLENRLKGTPARIKRNKLHAFLTEQQDKINSISKQLESRKANVDKLSAQFDELEHQYELERSDFEIMEKDEECTAAEMTECRRSLEALMDKVTRARKELYDTMAFIEKASAEYKETYAKAGKAKKEYDAIKLECDKETREAEPELKAAQAKLDALRKGVEPALMKKYISVKSHHAVPMARVENNQCGGCNMSLPTSVVKRVAAGTDLTECENCGRILYTPGENN